jgi:hypothetical protein
VPAVRQKLHLSPCSDFRDQLSLTDAGKLYAQFQSSSSSDTYGAGKVLGAQCQSALTEVEAFTSSYKTILPPAALSALDKFRSGHPGSVIRDADAAREARASLVFLAALEAEVSYLLAGRQELVRARSERAFLHLQRLLAVDEDVRSKWKDACDRGEVACEGLGAVHLLWHGIWAFKVDATGACTDLVFNEPIEASFEQRGVEGLVLTEWKVVDAKSAPRLYEQARIQADLYKEGPLVGSELTAYRFLVGVSLADLPPGSLPNDLTVAGVVYRHINIVVQPQSPSKRARSVGRGR